MIGGLAITAEADIIYVTVVSRSAVVRLDAEDRTQETVAFFRFGPPGCPTPEACRDTPRARPAKWRWVERKR